LPHQKKATKVFFGLALLELANQDTNKRSHTPEPHGKHHMEFDQELVLKKKWFVHPTDVNAYANETMQSISGVPPLDILWHLFGPIYRKTNAPIL
jgi:predicted metalloendopeptidase